jgi:hypothetical protein
MIVEIFQRLIDGDDNDLWIGQKYGLSKATFSRFAGNKWSKDLSGGPRIPDLWRNTARVVNSVPPFREVATELGILPLVQKIVKSIAEHEGRKRVDG